MAGSEPGYLLSPLLRSDLEDIWRYTFEKWSPEQADRYHAVIMTAILALADGSISGNRTNVREGYVKLRARSHIQFHRIAGTDLEFMRILRQRMDVDRHL